MKKQQMLVGWRNRHGDWWRTFLYDLHIMARFVVSAPQIPDNITLSGNDNANNEKDNDNDNDLKTNPKKKVLLTMSVSRYLAVIRMLL